MPILEQCERCQYFTIKDGFGGSNLFGGSLELASGIDFCHLSILPIEYDDNECYDFEQTIDNEGESIVRDTISQGNDSLPKVLHLIKKIFS